MTMIVVTKSRLLNVLIGFITLLLLPLAVAQESNFPRQIELGDGQGQVTLYSPQVDEMTEDAIRFRSALAWRENPGDEPVFGVGWFKSSVSIDRARGRVQPRDVTLLESRFPAGTPDIDPALSSALSREMAARTGSANFEFALSELEASLEMAQAEARSAEKLNTAPPDIIYRDEPALLVTLDGDPVLREIENSPYQAVINTPYPLIHDGKHYYLNAAKDVWYRADRATGPYRFDASPPADVAGMVNPDDESVAAEAPSEPVTAANAPEIVVTTRPAELVVTEGPAAFVPLVDDLLVLNNSDSDVFFDVPSQEYFIVLSGRWYRSASLDGPWRFEKSDQLPAAFANIPEYSDQADSRVYVAGTPESRDAVMDAQVPQTAAVERGQVEVEVQYDGDPQFAPVDGTQDMVYATNTGSSVVYSNRIYYLVEDGVWYESVSPHGPWEVSVQRPAQVAYIDPTSPVYNVKYVYIYDYTPRVVYVGYTPGYVGSYVYQNTLFYGSGWYYSPWVTASWYYPRPSTWGFHVGYNSWSGWNFGLSWGWGPFSFGYYSGGYWHRPHYWHHRHHGYWGPRGYCPRPVPYHRGRGHGRYAYDDYRGSRHDNLYADTRQPARVINTRDKQPRVRGGGRNPVRDKPAMRDAPLYALNDQNLDSRGGKPAAVRGGDYGKGPVKKADLREKAVRRDQPVTKKQPVAGKQPVGKRQPVASKQPTVKARPVAKTQPTVKARPVAKTQPTVKARPVAKTQPTVKARPVAKTQPTVKARPVAKTQPTVKARPVARKQPAVKTWPDSKGIPLPKSTVRSTPRVVQPQLSQPRVSQPRVSQPRVSQPATVSTVRAAKVARPKVASPKMNVPKATRPKVTAPRTPSKAAPRKATSARSAPAKASRPRHDRN